MTTTVWRTIAFTAAAPGWRLAYLSVEEPLGYFTTPLPGWMVQEACDFDPETDTMTPRLAGETRVMAAGGDCEGVLEPADMAMNFWMVLHPEAPPLPSEEAKQEIERRRLHRMDAVEAEE